MTTSSSDAATTTSPDLSDAEIDRICQPLRQRAAQARLLKRLGVHVERPYGRLIVNRRQCEEALGRRSATPTSTGPRPKWER